MRLWWVVAVLEQQLPTHQRSPVVFLGLKCMQRCRRCVLPHELWRGTGWQGHHVRLIRILQLHQLSSGRRVTSTAPAPASIISNDVACAASERQLMLAQQV
jgi:hypothetical protein